MAVNKQQIVKHVEAIFNEQETGKTLTGNDVRDIVLILLETILARLFKRATEEKSRALVTVSAKGTAYKDYGLERTILNNVWRFFSELSNYTDEEDEGGSPK